MKYRKETLILTLFVFWLLSVFYWFYTRPTPYTPMYDRPDMEMDQEDNTIYNLRRMP